MKKITILTGAGVSAESGIDTFRDTETGLWYNYSIDEVATGTAWKKTPEKVIDFHNMLRAKLKNHEPNSAHTLIAELEKDYEVNIFTQNVDDLHERAGSTNVFHLHGELYKSRSTYNPKLVYECLGDIKMGDKCEKGSQLRPHTVLFEEMPYYVDEFYEAVRYVDYIIIIGTSLQISYIPMVLRAAIADKIIYLDPKPDKVLNNFGLSVKYIKKPATKGMLDIIRILKKDKKNSDD